MCTARQYAAPRAAAATVTLLVVVLAGCGGDARVVGPGSPSATVEPPLAAFAASEWSEPVNLGAPVNSSERDQNASLANARVKVSSEKTKERKSGSPGRIVFRLVQTIIRNGNATW